MRIIKMIMELDGRKFGIGLTVKKDAKLFEYEEVLNAMNRAMLRTIMKEYFGFSKKQLIGDCLRREP